MSCECCAKVDTVFDQSRAEDDLARYRSQGPDATTAMLLNHLKERGVADKTILDIGGGVGVIGLELLQAGAARVTNAEASQAYVVAGRKAATEEGFAERVSFKQGDFCKLADMIEPADIVTLDAVLCCYADMESLVRASVAKAREVYALIYPRDVWWAKLGMFGANIIGLFLGHIWQTMHATSKVDALVEAAGFTKTFEQYHGRWQTVVFEKNQA